MDAAVRHYGSIGLLGAAAAAKGSSLRSCKPKGVSSNNSSWLLLRLSQPAKKNICSGFRTAAPLTPLRCAFSSSPSTTLPLYEAHEGIAVSKIQSDDTKTAHVRFVLQKACRFGDKFLIAGDDPIFGLWDPSSAIPMEWSEGHVWQAELDVPVGKTIQFKFILQTASGENYWQPGPDRILQSWETEKTIFISEDWENADSQKLTEEDSSAEEEMATTKPHVAVKLPENTQLDSIDEMISQESDYEKQNTASEGDKVLVAGFNSNSIPASVSVSSLADALLASEVVKECNSAQIEMGASERNKISEEITPAAFQNLIGNDPDAVASYNGTLPEDRDNEENSDGELATDVLKNDFNWGFKALQKLFFGMGFSMN